MRSSTSSLTAAAALLGTATMGNGQSTPFETCLSAVCGDRAECVGFPSTPFYQIGWVKSYNLHLEVDPAAVFRPESAEDVSAAILCAVENDVHVQAKSGGHSYANFATGGTNGQLMIDMVNFKSFSMDEETWLATAGAGFRLGELDEELHAHGARAIAHGTCPGVGLGGHATIGGIGPMSRMWGTALDHVVEVEVVTADGKIRRASETENEDLFWALRGAGASFGVITEFVLRTHPEPGEVVEYSYHFSFGSQTEMGPVYKEWQELALDPELDRRFNSLYIAQPLGALITGTFYGTEEEFAETGIAERIPTGGVVELELLGWLAHLAYQAELELMFLSDLPTPFDSKSLTFRREDGIADASVDELFTYMDEADSGTLAWFIIWDTHGGYTSDIPTNATAYANRDKLLMYQSYAIGIPLLSDITQDFVSGIHERIEKGAPEASMRYAGYVDPDVESAAAQEMYWGENLPRLREVKRDWDPNSVFKNPHSVDPAE